MTKVIDFLYDWHGEDIENRFWEIWGSRDTGGMHIELRQGDGLGDVKQYVQYQLIAKVEVESAVVDILTLTVRKMTEDLAAEVARDVAKTGTE